MPGLCPGAGGPASPAAGRLPAAAAAAAAAVLLPAGADGGAGCPGEPSGAGPAAQGPPAGAPGESELRAEAEPAPRA